MMNVRISWLVLAFGALVMLGANVAAAKEAQFVGARKCRSCHKKELIGNQYAEWEKGAHHKAFETLQSDKAKKIAAEKGLAGPPHESPDCLKCHVTAYGEPAARLAKGKALNPADGIQCESCHGPGSLYRKKKTMSDPDKAVAAGMWEPENDAKICTTCHNDESPTWDPAKGFDHEARMKEIAHNIPEDVKGKFLEIEKERKAKGEGGDDDEDEDEDE
jgi:ribosomal protein L40E